MTTIDDALKYLEHRLINDKQFALRMLAAVIYKTCDAAKLNQAVTKWKALNPEKTEKAEKQEVKVEKPKSQTSIKEQNDWDNL